MQFRNRESNRGRKIAVDEGHSYNLKPATINIHWHCKNFFEIKCPAIFKNKNELVFEMNGTHNYDCKPSYCAVEEVLYIFCYRTKQNKL